MQKKIRRLNIKHYYIVEVINFQKIYLFNSNIKQFKKLIIKRNYLTIEGNKIIPNT